MLAAYWIFKVFILSSGSMFLFIPYLLEVASNVVMGGAGTFAAFIVAPSHNKIAAIVAAAVIITVSIILIVMGLGRGMLDFWLGVYLVAMMAGALIAAVILPKDI
jgi:hypothetical protein